VKPRGNEGCALEPVIPRDSSMAFDIQRGVVMTRSLAKVMNAGIVTVGACAFACAFALIVPLSGEITTLPL
jgi:hypothetical protein